MLRLELRWCEYNQYYPRLETIEVESDLLLYSLVDSLVYARPMRVIARPLNIKQMKQNKGV